MGSKAGIIPETEEKISTSRISEKIIAINGVEATRVGEKNSDKTRRDKAKALLDLK